MENENKKEGKIKTFIKNTVQKAKTCVGKHMWMKDFAIFSAGTTTGVLICEVFIPLGKEIVKQASIPLENEIDVGDGVIKFIPKE